MLTLTFIEDFSNKKQSLREVPRTLLCYSITSQRTCCVFIEKVQNNIFLTSVQVFLILFTTCKIIAPQKNG